MSESSVDAGRVDLSIGNTGRAAVVSPCHMADGFALEDSCAEGVAIQSLAPGTTLIVQTRNSQYRVVVLDGRELSVLVNGGPLLPEPTRVRLLGGANARGRLLRTGWVGAGLSLEMWVGDRQIVTSPVQSITIETVPPVQHTLQ